jgi:hypothetical protein
VNAEREGRPDELAESPDEEIPQDPGIPGVKLPADEPRQGAEDPDDRA